MIGGATAAGIPSEVANVGQTLGPFAHRVRRRVVEKLQCRAVGEVAEVVQVARGDLDGAVPQPRLHGRQRHTLKDPVAGGGVAQVVKGAPVADSRPVRLLDEHRAVQLPAAGSGEQQVVRALALGESADDRRQRVGQRDTAALPDFGVCAAATPSGWLRTTDSIGIGTSEQSRTSVARASPYRRPVCASTRTRSA